MWRYARQTVVSAGTIVGIVACGAIAENKFAAVTFRPNGNFATFAHVSIENGLEIIRQDLPPRLNSLTSSPSGMLFAAASGDAMGELYSIHPVTGDYELLHELDVSIRALAMSTTGEMFATDGDTIQPTPYRLVTLDVDTGESNLIGELWGDVICAQGLGFSPDGVLYGICPHTPVSGTYDFFTIDLDDAETHLIGSDLSGRVEQSVEFAPDGSLYGIGEDGLCELDPNSGVCIDSISFSGDWRGLAYIPEPTSLLILTALIVVRRRRR